MEPIIYPILGVNHVTHKEFVQFWEQFYFGYDEDFYRKNIGQPLTKERIADWFKWKNGKPLSKNKSQSIERYSSAEERISHNADARDLAAFLNRSGGPIWRIFWLHLQHPKVFPIYDQHVHRAMAILLKCPEIELPSSNPEKVRIYLDVYCPFFKQFEDCEHRQVDRALWTFGQLLGRNPRLASWLTSGTATERLEGVRNRKGTGNGGESNIHADHPPLRVDEGGVVRVGKNRISLDLIVEQYDNGMTPEDMVRTYDTLVLADVHAVIAYYLRHRDEVRGYLERRAEEAAALRTKIEAERPRVSREELLARRGAREKTNAPTGQ